MGDSSACRFCGEALGAGVTKCPHCGEPLLAKAVLQWKRLEVVILEPGDMPMGVCFACARTRPTLPIRKQDPGGSRTVEVPTCAGCSRRTAAVPLVLVVGLSLAAGLAMCLLSSLRVMQGDQRFVATAAFGACLVVAFGVVVYALRARRVTVRWDPEVALVVPDAHGLRRAVEQDGL